jgi:tetratricopeptide (TPR) repeat protein
MDVNKALQEALKHLQSGNLHTAKDIYTQILSIHPDNINALHFLGLTHYQDGNLDTALRYITKAVVLGPNYADAQNNLGNVLLDMGRTDDAVTCFRKAISLNPGLCNAYINLGTIFQKQGNLDEAVNYYQRAAECDPVNAEIHFTLGLIHQQKGNIDTAIDCYKNAVRHDADFFPANHALGITLQNKGLIADAIPFHQKAIQLNPTIPELYYNLGVALQETGHFDNAIAQYRKAVELKPDYAESYLNISLIHLLTGNFKDGWREFEWRWKSELFGNRIFSQPSWDGSDIRGRTILVYAEQGLGDTIQFIRYVPLLARRGTKVIVECQKELTSLLKDVGGIDQIVERGDPLPEFDVHCPLLSLPLLFNTTLENIPAEIPYISVDPTKVEKWRGKVEQVNAKLRIGLVWAGKPTYQKVRHRSFPLSLFAPLANLEGIALYSLQKGEASQQVKNPPDGLKIIDYTNEIADFSDTAAFIENLALIISVDTSVAHLAGAMGKPTWTLLPFIPDWRWLLNREDSPWYPTMRLFRQPKPGDRQAVIEKITEELRNTIPI